MEAVAAAGFTHKTDFYHTLRATLIHRAEHLEVFDQIFAMFWRDPDFIERMIHLFSPMLRREAEEQRKKAAQRRASEALNDAAPPPAEEPEREELQSTRALSWSAAEKLRAMDFEQMSAAEIGRPRRRSASCPSGEARSDPAQHRVPERATPRPPRHLAPVAPARRRNRAHRDAQARTGRRTSWRSATSRGP